MSEGGWDIGGYAPIGYKVVPWTTLFPALGKFAKSTSLSSIYIAKTYTYYLTRLQFGQYLAFLSDVGKGGIVDIGNDAIDTDVLFFNDYCSTLYQKIRDNIDAGPINAEIYKKIVTEFEVSVRESTEFYSQNVYNIFFKNYAFFVQCAYGFIYVVLANQMPSYPRAPLNNPESYVVGTYPHGYTLNPVPTDPFTVFPMLEHATRVYPGISRAGHTWTAQWSDELGCWLPGPKWPFLEKLRDLQGIPFRQPENNGFRYIWWIDPDNGNLRLHFYMIGLDIVPDDYQGKIRGLPMFYKMPFTVLASFADPGNV